MSLANAATRPHSPRAPATARRSKPEQSVTTAVSKPDRTTADLSALDFPAAMTLDQMEAFERAAQDIGMSRRVTLVMLTKSRDELTEIVGGMLQDKDSEGLIDGMLVSLDGWKQHLTNCLDLAKCAEAQMAVAIDTLEASGQLDGETPCAAA